MIMVGGFKNRDGLVRKHGLADATASCPFSEGTNTLIQRKHASMLMSPDISTIRLAEKEKKR
jgi:hypothetical protein